MHKYKISNIKTLKEGAELRIISSQRPHGSASVETPALEDVFLYYFGEKAGEAYDEI